MVRMELLILKVNLQKLRSVISRTFSVSDGFVNVTGLIKQDLNVTTCKDVDH